MQRHTNGTLVFDNNETDNSDILKHIADKDELRANVRKDSNGKWGFDVFTKRPVALSLPIFDSEKDVRNFIKNNVSEIQMIK